VNKVNFEMFKSGDFDFVDFGCKKGGSFEFCKRVLGGGRGLGIDNNPSYVEEFCRNGEEAITADVTETGLPDNFARFVCVSHMLEHLPNWELVEKATIEAIRIARDFVYIVGPYFDADNYLETLGLKFFWSDWSWHPTHVDAKSLATVLRKHKISKFVSRGNIRIKDSDDPNLHPLDSQRNQHEYDADIHPPKRSHIKFDQPIFKEMVFLIPKNESVALKPVIEALKLADPLKT